MKTLRTATRFLLRWGLSICGLVLVCASAAHRLQLDAPNPQTYTASPWVGIEVVLMIMLLFLLLVPSPLYAIHLIVKKRWRDLGMLAINVGVGFVCLLVAMQLDAPTLVFMT